MLEQVTELNSMIMASRYSKYAHLAPLSPLAATPAVRAEIMVCGKVEVDSGPTEGELNLRVHVNCLFDGQNNWVWP